MDALIIFGPVILNALILMGIIYFIWYAFKRRSHHKDQMLEQLMTKNKELEEKVDQLLEISKGNKEEV
jgi:arginine exporter protein ArgO